MQLIEKQKQDIKKQYGVNEDTDEEEDVKYNIPVPKVLKQNKENKKQKKIKTLYIEESESEEEIIYIKKEKQQPKNIMPNIQFY